jgi:benzil reductase ((S)-benzoin forming)
MFIITGGGSGIGRALAHALAKREHEVLIVGRREHMLEETASYSSRIKTLSADISTQEGREKIVNFCEDIPTIAALVNNAGIVEPIAPITAIDVEAWHKILKTNLDPVLFLPQLLEEKLKGGRVLNMSTQVAYVPAKGWTAYCVSKAAMSMLTRCWQLESKNIAFASVLPGIANTDMQAICRSSPHMDPEKTALFQRIKEENRLISTDTVAQFLCWLLLDIETDKYQSQVWDIYDTTHHTEWLRPPHQVLYWNV